MPVQIRNQASVGRPSGQVQPPAVMDGDVELRLHGVGGTSPEDLLGDLAPQCVAGDRIAGFYRTADQPANGESARHIEAYSWGGLTSRSASRVLWVLMLPFALANLAGWMCTPDLLARKNRFRLHRFAVRFAGLVMTVNVVVLLVMAGSDLIGYQCVQSASCRKAVPVVPLLTKWFFADHPARTVVAGSLLPIAALLLVYLLSRLSSRRYEGVHAPMSAALDAGEAAIPDVAPRCHSSAARPTVGLADRNFWNGFESASRLSILHLATGLAAVALVVSWITHHTLAPHDTDWSYIGAAVLAALTILATVVSLALDTCRAAWTHTMLASSIASLVCATVDAWTIGANAKPPAVLSGMRLTANCMYGIVVAAILLTALAVAIGRGRKPKSFWWPAPTIVLALAFGIVNAVGALIVIRIGSWVGAPQVEDPSASDHRNRHLYGAIGSVSAWAFLAAIGAVICYAIVVWAIWWRKGRGTTYSDVVDMYPADPAPGGDPWIRRAGSDSGDRDDRKWLAGIARVRFLAALPRHADVLLTLIVVASAIALGIVELFYWVLHVNIEPVSQIRTITTWSAAALPLLLVALMRWGWRSKSARKHIGIAWDVATFWPRAYHPFAPPCYAERAVPDLQWRLWHLQSKGANVTLVAHSQGSVIAAAALMQQDARKPGSAVGLLTFGSPLDTLYRWAFPAYFSNEALRGIMAPRISSRASVCRWRNLYYQTDYIGRTDIDGAANEVLPDPPSRDYVVGQRRPVIGSHSGYWTDPAVWDKLDELNCAKLIPAPTSTPSDEVLVPQQLAPERESSVENDPGNRTERAGGG
jgi:hypothetical protein